VKSGTKFVMDIVMGAVIPILILRYLTEPWGATPALIVSALVPVVWIFIDLFFITKRFNFITSYIGLSAVVRGALAFWLVDGVAFAIKDSASFIVTVIVFGATLFAHRPIMHCFLAQALNPDTPEKERSLNELLTEPPVRRALFNGSILVLIVEVLAGVANFWLNYVIVTAQVRTDIFNQQVAQVNAITRIALTIPTMLGFMIGFWLIYRALYRHLPREGDKPQLESDFWDLMRLRDLQKQQA
jgi:hypothetical protein